MAILGKLLRNRRAGELRLAWYRPNLAVLDTFDITSPDFPPGGVIPLPHVAKQAGGRDLSPALSWTPPHVHTAQFLLVIEDPDAPLRTPIVHGLALLDPTLTHLPQDAFTTPPPGMQILRATLGRGYRGPAPVPGHGPHRYAFQLFALPEPLRSAHGKPIASARPGAVLASARAVARARVDGFVERP